MSVLNSPRISLRDEDLASRRASGSLSLLPPVVVLQAAGAAKKDLRISLREHSSGRVVILVFRRGEPTMVFSPGDGRSVGEMLVAAGRIEEKQLHELLRERKLVLPISLEQFLAERLALTREEIQKFLDYQARMRLLEALAWQQGYFEIAEYTGGGETTYHLELPSLDSLCGRARARAAQLPGLLGRLPGPPAEVVVRRKRGAPPPNSGLGKAIYEVLHRPLFVPEIIARLLIDDDLILEALLDLAAAKIVVLHHELKVVSHPRAARVHGDLLSAQMLSEVIRRFRGIVSEGWNQALWVVVFGAEGELASQLVSRLGRDQEEVVFHSSEPSVSLLARSVPVGPYGRLHLLALQPELLSPAALAGVLGRCDAVILVRTNDHSEEEAKLQKLRSLAQGAGFGWQPLVVGLDVGTSSRPWQDFPEAILALPSVLAWDPQDLIRRILEALLAAANSRVNDQSWPSDHSEPVK